MINVFFLWLEIVSFELVAKTIQYKKMSFKNCEELKQSHKNILAQQFYFHNRKGSTVEGFFSHDQESTQKTPVVVYFQGWRNFKERNSCSWFKYFFLPFNSKGYSLISINYPGVGKTQGKDEWGGRDVFDFIDLQALLNKISNKIDSHELFAFGASRGSLIALRSMREGFKFKAISVWGGIFDQFKYPFLRDNYGFNVKQLKKRSPMYWGDKIDKPFLIMHGEKDFVSKLEDAKKMFEGLKLARNKKRLIILKGEGHSGIKSWDRIIKESVEWFNKFVN